MLMPPITARLSVEDGQYWITDMDPDVAFELPEPGGAGGLAGAAGNLAVVLTGTQFGNVRSPSRPRTPTPAWTRACGRRSWSARFAAGRPGSR